MDELTVQILEEIVAEAGEHLYAKVSVLPTYNEQEVALRGCMVGVAGFAVKRGADPKRLVSALLRRFHPDPMDRVKEVEVFVWDFEEGVYDYVLEDPQYQVTLEQV